MRKRKSIEKKTWKSKKYILDESNELVNLEETHEERTLLNCSFTIWFNFDLFILSAINLLTKVIKRREMNFFSDLSVTFIEKRNVME